MLDAHMPDQTPTINLNKDPGAIAREKLSAKSIAIQKSKAFWRFIKLTLLLSIIGIAGVVLYKVNHMPMERVTDSRPCSFNDETKELELTGTRYYTYKKYTLFGIQFRKGDSVDV